MATGHEMAINAVLRWGISRGAAIDEFEAADNPLGVDPSTGSGCEMIAASVMAHCGI
jgi:hypothetical protein